VWGITGFKESIWEVRGKKGKTRKQRKNIFSGGRKGFGYWDVFISGRPGLGGRLIQIDHDGAGGDDKEGEPNQPTEFRHAKALRRRKKL